MNTEMFSDAPAKSFDMYNFLCGVCNLSVEEKANIKVLCGKKQSSIEEAMTAASSGMADFYAKRDLTHKAIRVHSGASNLPNTYTTKYIRR